VTNFIAGPGGTALHSLAQQSACGERREA